MALPENDPFWQGQQFQIVSPPFAPTHYPLLISNDTLLAVLGSITTHQSAAQGTQVALLNPLLINWYYALDTSHFTSVSLGALANQLNQVTRDISNQPVQPPYIEQTTATGPLDLFAGYSNRLSVLQVSVTSLPSLVVALVFFIPHLFGGSGARSRVLVLPWTSLVGVLFFMLACLFLLLRLAPQLLQLLGDRMAQRRGVVPLLAVAHMARTPRQALRMMLLLALAIAFPLFTLTFYASQTARATDAAAFQVGSDFSGQLPPMVQAGSCDTDSCEG